MLAYNPLHGAGRAGFPHPAFDFGDHAHATQGIWGYKDDRQWAPTTSR
jgi:hypothetical protein